MKTQKSFKKKALLSSLAMLMVALVALSSATYAWFSTKTTATAQNVKVKTTQASSLVLSLDKQDWASTIDLNIDKTLEPGSTSNLTNWFAATSTGYDQGTVDAATIVAGVEGTNYVAKTFYVKSIGADLNVNWKLLWDSAQKTTDKNYMRIAMTMTDTSTNQVFWWSDDGVTTEAIANSNGSTTEVTSSSTETGTMGALTADTEYTINLYVWFEGQDAECIDTKAGTVGDFDIEFSKAA